MCPLGKVIPVSVTFLVLYSGLAQTSYADAIIVPNLRTSTEGNDNYLNGPQPFSLRIQQVFASTQFAAFGGPRLITQIAFRPDGPFGSAFTFTNPVMKIRDGRAMRLAATPRP